MNHCYLYAVCSTILIATTTYAESNKMLYDLEKTAAHRGWRIVNDTVMGGRSSSRITHAEDGSLVFSGNVSLENNGGFASVRGPALEGGLKTFDGIRIRVVGDGKRYKCGIRTNDRFDGIFHQVVFDTVKGKELTIDLPFSTFDPTWRGRRLPEKMRMSADSVRNICFLISDKQQGSFELKILGIEAYKEENTFPEFM